MAGASTAAEAAPAEVQTKMANGGEVNGKAESSPAANGVDHHESDAANTSAAEDAAEPADVERVETVNRLYFVRMPRPPIDEAQAKRLQEELQTHTAKIRALSTKLSAKRVRRTARTCLSAPHLYFLPALGRRWAGAPVTHAQKRHTCRPDR